MSRLIVSILLLVQFVVPVFAKAEHLTMLDAGEHSVAAATDCHQQSHHLNSELESDSGGCAKVDGNECQIRCVHMLSLSWALQSSAILPVNFQTSPALRAKRLAAPPQIIELPYRPPILA